MEERTNVTYGRGAPELVAGVMQINFRIPAGIAIDNSVPLTIQVGGILADAAVTVAVANEMLSSNVRQRYSASQ